jgi:hypothetical protein
MFPDSATLAQTHIFAALSETDATYFNNAFQGVSGQ